MKDLLAALGMVLLFCLLIMAGYCGLNRSEDNNLSAHYEAVK